VSGKGNAEKKGHKKRGCHGMLSMMTRGPATEFMVCRSLFNDQKGSCFLPHLTHHGRGLKFQAKQREGEVPLFNSISLSFPFFSNLSYKKGRIPFLFLSLFLSLFFIPTSFLV
jgi:hypothetical protein